MGVQQSASPRLSPRDTITPSPSPPGAQIAMAQGPLIVAPTRLTFGYQPGTALPVSQEVTETVIVQNALADSGLDFSFEVSPYHKCNVWADPRVGTLMPGQSASVRVSLYAHCTTASLRPPISVLAWRSADQYTNASHPVAVVPFDIALETKLTSRLDFDELEREQSPIGDGSFASVYRANYRGLTVAVKVLKRQDELTEAMVAAFVSEVSMMEKLRHQCVIQFIGAVHLPGKLSIVTEFCEYGSLNDCLKKNRLSWPLKLKCLYDAARGCDFLHRSNILHRDLKPDNLLIVSLEVRAPVVAKISDFGTTRDVNMYAEELTCTRGIGTPIFMAPEVLRGRSYEKPADVYSYALMMHNVAGNRLPYTDDPDIKQAWQFAQLVIGGKRPRIPSDWPEVYVSLMKSAWNQNPYERPTFSDIVKSIIARETMRRLPKADLHRHLDGSVRVSTIIDLAREQGVELPSFDPDTLRGLVSVDYTCESLEQYLRGFDITLLVLQRAYAITRVMYEVCEDAWRDGVKYLEVRFSPIEHTQQGLSLASVMEAICEGLTIARMRLPIMCQIIVCAMRQLPPCETEPIAQIAWRYRHKGVCGFDLAGPEKGFPPQLHRVRLRGLAALAR
eukprot:m51a1_g12956 adenosine deaminase, putative (617) ;mRNA; r:9-2984